MPFTLVDAALEDHDDDERETLSDHLLLEYDFLLPASPAADDFYRIADESDSPVSMTLDDDDDALALELELGLDQYDALEGLLQQAHAHAGDGDEHSQCEERGEMQPVESMSSAHEFTVLGDVLMETGTILTTDGGTADLVAAADHFESVTARRRRPRDAAAPAGKQLVATTKTSGEKKQLKYNSNKARDERREELLYLRRKVVELEASLAELRQEPPQHLLGAKVVGDGGSLIAASQRIERRARMGLDAKNNNRAVVATMDVWQEIASRQYEHRMKAERENIRLKLVLESQLKIAKSLEKLLKKTSSTKEFEKCFKSNTQRRISLVNHASLSSASHTSDGELFEKLLAGVEQSYKEVDDVFETTGLARMESSRIDARVQQTKPHHSLDSNYHQIELQVFGSKVMPFDMHATGLAVWNHYVFAKERIPNRSYCHNSPQTMVNSTADTIMENFNVQVDVNATSVLFCLKLVLRRYIEEERIVVVWRAFFDPTQVSNEPLSGVRFLERGYVVVKKQQHQSGEADKNASMSHNLLQTCFISTPVSIGDLVHADPSKVGALTDLVLSATAANIASSHQMIENVLLEQAMRKNGGGRLVAAAAVQAF